MDKETLKWLQDLNKEIKELKETIAKMQERLTEVNNESH